MNSTADFSLSLIPRRLPRSCIAGLMLTALASALAQAQTPASQGEIVVSASRAAQTRFDAPAAIDVVTVDAFRATSPLVNLSELLGAVPGLQIRERQNYAQDLQVSVRGFGTRSTFGVRGVRILVDDIPATMPDGQGQAATASLSAASRIEVLRGPMAQMYGNSAGGVLQVFTRNPPGAAASRGDEAATASITLGAGSDQQRQIGASFAGGSELIGAVLDVSKYSTDGYRDHSAAERTQFAGKIVLRASAATTVTAMFNQFDQPIAQDPLGLTQAAYEQNPRQVIAGAVSFDTRKKIAQQQGGVVLDHQLADNDALKARLYSGTRQVNQTLALSGSATNSSGGVVDLDRDYGGVGLNWTHKMRVNGLPLSWVIGVEADQLRELRRGFVNNAGVAGDLRRDESDRARNRDIFGQIDWRFAPDWRATAGVRTSQVGLSVDDHYITAASPNDSGSVDFHNTSPVAGLVWHASDALNVYANLGRGFETPTLAESAYRAVGTGPNLSLLPSTSVQAELGAKIKSGRHAIDLALFDARSKNEIVPSTVINGRAIYQNADGVQRRGADSGWQASWNSLTTRLAYTWLDARFQKAFYSAPNVLVAEGNRLPGAPEHSLYIDAQYQFSKALMAGLELKAESQVQVNDVNTASAPGYALWNARTGYALRLGAADLFVFGRIDNLLDKRYTGSVIVNDGNGRFFEPAPGRRFFMGVRTAL